MNPGVTARIAPALAIAALLAASVLLRVTALDRGLPDERHHFSYHPDEYNVLRALGAMDPASLDFNPRYFHNPSLYYYLCGGTYELLARLGVMPTLRRSDFHERPRVVAGFYRTGRVLSVIAGLITIAMLAMHGLQRHGVVAAWVTGAVVAFSPAHMVMSQYMDVDVWLCLFAAAVVVMTTEAVARRSARHVVLAAGCAGLGMATKYNGVLLVAPILVAIWLQGRGRVRLVTVASLVGLCCFLIGAPYTILDWPGFLAGVRYVLHERVGQRWSGLGHGVWFPLTHAWTWLVGEGHLLATFVAIVVARRLPRRVELLPAILLVCATYAVAAASGTDYVRYSLPALPGLALLIGRLAARVDDSGRPARLPLAIISVGMAISAARLLALEGVILQTDPRDGADAFLARAAPSGTRVVVATEPYFFSPPILFTDYHYQGRSNSWRRTGRGLEVVNANWDSTVLLDGRTDLLVLSEYELTYPAAAGTTTARFLAEATAGTRFQEVARFDSPARLGPLSFEGALPEAGWAYTAEGAALLRDRRLPHDLKYLNPAVLVFRLATAPP